MTVQKGGVENKTIEDYFKEEKLELFNRKKHDIEVDQDAYSLVSTRLGSGPEKTSLVQHYNPEYIIGIFKEKPEQEDEKYRTKFKETSRGDRIYFQHGTKSCSISASFMIAISKGFEIPEEFLIKCQIQGLIFEAKKEYEEFAQLLKKTLIFKPIDKNIKVKDKLKIIDDFIKEYGVSGISSDGHIKVVDSVINSSGKPPENMSDIGFLIIRDQLAYHQFVYALVDDNKLGPHNIEYIFTYVK